MGKPKKVIIGEVYPNSYWFINKLWSKKNNGISERWINATCKCGVNRDMRFSTVRNGGKSCGCYQKKRMTEIHSKIPEIGQKFGWWEILYRTDDYIYKNPNHHRRPQYMCKCICGFEKPIRINELYGGYNTNCGCKKRERIIRISTKHGDAKRGNNHKFYGLWKDINKRCDPKQKNNPKFERWSGRNDNPIVVCEEWNKKNPNGWINFRDYMENNPELCNKPEGDYSFDRINNDGHYEPDNVRWATRKEQIENTEIMKIYRSIGNKREDRNPADSWRNRRDYQLFYKVKIAIGNQIHHIDWNWSNNEMSNLIEVTKKQHKWLHRTVNKQLRFKTREEIIEILKQNNI